MINVLIGILLVVLSSVFIVVRKTYLQIPVKELKRRATKNEPGYSDLYKAVAYGSSLQGFLWFLIIILSALGFVIIASNLSLLIAVIVISILVFVSYIWLPNSRLSDFGQKITITINPALVWLLSYLDPLIKKISTKTESWSHKEFQRSI